MRLREQRRVAAEIAGLLNLARSTTARWIQRAGLGKLSGLEPTQPVKRYEKSYAGELVHLDIKKLGRIDTPGHRVTGSRKNRRKPGWEFTHVAIDDYSRISEAAFYPDETASSAVDFLFKVVEFFRHKGIHVQNILTDNGGCYCSTIFHKACRQLGIRHYRTRPYRPQTNGKAERFIQTLLKEWAYRFVYQSSAERESWLQPYLHFYNHHRMHQALKSQPPISRLSMNNLVRFHT
jgi:transposase InsO family protein